MRILNEEIERRIAEIGADKRHGAVHLAREAAVTLGMVAALDNYPLALEAACRALIAAQPSMAPMVNLANRALRSAVSPSALETLCDGFVRDLAEGGRRIAEQASVLISAGATVLTYSASRTVFEALRRARHAGVSFRVVATESRPAGEGVAQARELAAAGLPVTVAIDAAMLDLLGKADVAMVGADAVMAQGFLNKRGTSLLALAARHLGKKLYVLCGSEKLVPAGYRMPAEVVHPAGELVPDPPKGLAVDNRYFDQTPLEWTAGFLTETGRLSSWQIRQRIERDEIHPALLAG